MLHDVDTTVIATLLMQQLEYAICVECCCVYTDVETATCGHSLCSSCWQSQRVCSTCMARATQTQRRRNLPLQTLATHSQTLLRAFEKLFHITGTVVYKHQSQTDWDKIETMPNSQVVHSDEDQHNKNTLIPVYTCENPRRSSRNKDLQTVVETSKLTKENDGSLQSDKKAELAKSNWNNVKKMKKEFSKLNKIHRTKLNVSIENIKRAKSSTRSIVKDHFENLPHTPYVIDEESPMISTLPQKSQEHIRGEDFHTLNNFDIEQQNKSEAVAQESTDVNCNENNTLINNSSKVVNSVSNHEQNVCNTDKPTSNKIYFFKRGKLCHDFCKECDNTLKQMHCVACQTSECDNILIDIKIGNMLTKIVINGEKDIQVKKQTSTQTDNKEDKTANDLLMTRHEKDVEVVDLRQRPLEISDVLQDSRDLLEKHSPPNESSEKNSKNNLTQLERIDAQEHTVVVENIVEVDSTTNIDPEELDIFNNTPPIQDDVQFLKNADPGPSKILVSVGSKRVCGTDISIPFAKRVRLGDSSPHSCPLDSQSNSEPAQQLHSENVFSLLEKLACQSANEPQRPASINANHEFNRHNDYGDKSDHDLLTVESISNRSIIEESQCPEVVSVATNIFSTCDIKDSVKAAKESTHNPVVHTDTNRKINRDRVAIESVPNNELPLRTQTLETPLSMTNFVNSIEHNSTPLARKSLRYDRATLETESVDVTLCPTNANGPNTQEREFISMENIPRQPAQVAPVTLPCVAGSNLKGSELAKLKSLCTKLGWTFLENYSPTLTHLVITVDDENKAQRTVKYMCALAAGKWVVSFAWAERCAVAGRLIPEMPFEALDLTGAPGPRRSRTATRQLFAGFTFYCMPPFALLDIATLEGMLKASGARVVESAAAARADGREPHLVLAGSDQSQTPENRFIYMAMELCVVPVSVDWVLDSLGAYELCPLRDSLLCPDSLVTEYARHWLPPLLDGQMDYDLADESVPPSP
ncbi:Breast cancer type 1 susceptibility protein homolog [Eumeta japonica]|uniref:Breast cancer type 1 susceptibility protein homolog n=1 Tax=Eumeta variegata TaxID=151549 RepID=A0A4C1W2D9_EUMVA|nr:Breast cancer type 1 susceptibility protein homolog [Eumeta japonica]